MELSTLSGGSVRLQPHEYGQCFQEGFSPGPFLETAKLTLPTIECPVPL
jgi:hypothetical protein